MRELRTDIEIEASPARVWAVLTDFERYPEWNPQKTFRWLGHLLIPGLFDGEHIFELEPFSENSTRLIQREEFQGILVGLFWRNLDTDVRSGFVAMNEALKKRVEENTDRVRHIS